MLLFDIPPIPNLEGIKKMLYFSSPSLLKIESNKLNLKYFVLSKKLFL